MAHEFEEHWLSAYLDNELSADERALVEQRLQADPAARQLFDDLKRVRSLVATLPGWQGGDLKPDLANMQSVPRASERADQNADGNGRISSEVSGEVSDRALAAENADGQVQYSTSLAESRLRERENAAAAQTRRSMRWTTIVAVAAGLATVMLAAPYVFRSRDPVTGLAQHTDSVARNQPAPETKATQPKSQPSAETETALAMEASEATGQSSRERRFSRGDSELEAVKDGAAALGVPSSKLEEYDLPKIQSAEGLALKKSVGEDLAERPQAPADNQVKLDRFGRGSMPGSPESSPSLETRGGAGTLDFRESTDSPSRAYRSDPAAAADAIASGVGAGGVAAAEAGATAEARAAGGAGMGGARSSGSAPGGGTAQGDAMFFDSRLLPPSPALAAPLERDLALKPAPAAPEPAVPEAMLRSAQAAAGPRSGSGALAYGDFANGALANEAMPRVAMARSDVWSDVEVEAALDQVWYFVAPAASSSLTRTAAGDATYSYDFSATQSDQKSPASDPGRGSASDYGSSTGRSLSEGAELKRSRDLGPKMYKETLGTRANNAPAPAGDGPPIGLGRLPTDRTASAWFDQLRAERVLTPLRGIGQLSSAAPRGEDKSNADQAQPEADKREVGQQQADQQHAALQQAAQSEGTRSIDRAAQQQSTQAVVLFVSASEARQILQSLETTSADKAFAKQQSRQETQDAGRITAGQLPSAAEPATAAELPPAWWTRPQGLIKKDADKAAKSQTEEEEKVILILTQLPTG